MNSRHCPHCNFTTTVKIGTTSSGKHRYKCKNCHKTWTSISRPERLEQKIWNDYVVENLTIKSLANKYHISQRKISLILEKFEVPPIIPPKDYKATVICVDVTYIGRKYGFLSVLDAYTGVCLYCSLTRGYETAYDYERALIVLRKRGINPRAVVMDGNPKAMKMFRDNGLVVQMCQFHMIRIMTKYLTKKPSLEQNMDLRRIVLSLPHVNREQFERMFYSWDVRNAIWLTERYWSENGKYEYSHQKTKSLVRSIKILIPYLFTFEYYPELKIPNTNNLIEGVHSALKSKLNIHRGAKKSLKTKIVFSFLSGRTGV